MKENDSAQATEGPLGGLTCQELVEVITSYIEGMLNDEDRARFEAHLDRCEGCRTYLDQMRRTIAMVGRLSERSLEPRMRERLLQAFRGWKGA
jgi:anti-sigma factor RsiW